VTNTLQQWAADWGIPQPVLADLRRRLADPTVTVVTGRSEAAVQAQVRLEAARVGTVCWRNNVGVLRDDRGVPVRYGLANDSKAVNTRFKSADLIGIKPLVVTPEMVGSVVGQFWSRECKFAGWTYRGDAHEVAQLNWAQLVQAHGGDAGFAS